jgi:hypothetical protein
MDISRCDVRWLSPSKDSLGSMPIGNGDGGANVWVTEDGVVHFFLSKTDSWDECARLLKLGEVILTFDAPVEEWLQFGFEQHLDLAAGCLHLRFGAQARPALKLRLWFDAHRPVLWIEEESESPLSWTATVRTWRTAERQLDKAEANASNCQDGLHDQAWEFPDTVLPADLLGSNRIGLAHRNRQSMLKDLLDHQGLSHLHGDIDDVLQNRTFGFVLQSQAASADSRALEEQTLSAAQPATEFSLSIVLDSGQPVSLEAWTRALVQSGEDVLALSGTEAQAAHESWWRSFWERSWIELRGDAAAEAITRVYQLQRYVNACSGRGLYPIKFNGSIFTMQGPEETNFDKNNPRLMSPDYRRWGGGYWFQNTRLVYWTLLASGDWEMAESWFNLFERIAPLCRVRAQEQLGAEGLFFPETMTLWGAFRNDNYGYERPDDLPHGLPVNKYIRYYWQGGLELSLYMLDVLAHTGDTAWWRRQAYPLVADLLRFYPSWYDKRNDKGEIVMEPSQSLETWLDATNPTPDIAGLRTVLERLLALSEEVLPAEDRQEWQDLLERIPPLPLGPCENDPAATRILPAERYEQRSNMENCSLYAVFPYPMGALGGPYLKEARNAWPERRMEKVGGWFQDGLHAAMLGLSQEAADCVTAAFALEHATEQQRARRHGVRCEQYRFPAFFGPNFDWVPDQDHTAVNMLALQRMALQGQHNTLRVLPAWPKEWDVSFRLHAPGGTVVEVAYEKGELRKLDIVGDAYDPETILLPEGLTALDLGNV